MPLYIKNMFQRKLCLLHVGTSERFSKRVEMSGVCGGYFDLCVAEKVKLLLIVKTILQRELGLF